MTNDLFGPLPARASRTAKRAKKAVPTIQGTYGRTYIESFAKLNDSDSPLLYSWENRLRERMTIIGSTESALIWREKVIGPGLSISRLVPSRFSGNTGSEESTGSAYGHNHDGCNYWSDAEWIICHDGKARRTKPGIRLLVNGLPGRVDLWSIAGNAINPQAAAEVIKALMDVLPHGL